MRVPFTDEAAQLPRDSARAPALGPAQRFVLLRDRQHGVHDRRGAHKLPPAFLGPARRERGQDASGELCGVDHSI